MKHKLSANCVTPEKHHAPLCKAPRLLAIRLRRPNLNKAAKFFVDFGLSVIAKDENHVLLRGRSSDTACVIIERGPKAYVGFTLEIANLDDLEKLSRFHNAPIKDSDFNRGGKAVSLKAPGGFQVEALYGFNALPSTKAPSLYDANNPQTSPRINEAVRLDIPKAALVNKLGHTVLGVEHFDTSVRWLQENFGFIVSDFQLLKEDKTPTIAFMRCDQGETPVDHHTIAVGSVVDTGHLHTAFEMEDMDGVACANEMLKRKKHRHSWGIGRHILGSQIFDYWRDPSGDLFEHYADGDLFDSQVPTGYHLFTGDSIAQWGPDITNDFAGKKPTYERAKTLFRRLSGQDDLSIKRLYQIIQATR